MSKSILLHAGLSGNEAEVYTILLQSGQSLASAIAKKTKISRPHVYDSLNKLLEKGLVSYVIKSNRRHYSAANPKELLKYLDEEKDKITEKQKDVEEHLPLLLKMHSLTRKPTSVEVYEGNEGLKTVLKDITDTGKGFVGFGASSKFEKILPTFSKVWVKRREQLGIKARLLVVEGVRPISTPMNEYKIIPKEYSSPTSTVVYGEKVAILLWLNEPIGIIIRNAETAHSYKNYFELLWKIGKKFSP